jgi:hypothetical protein
MAMGFLLARYVKNSDDNNRKQWDRLDNHEVRVTTLETEHKMFKENGGCVHFHVRRGDKEPQ